MTTSDDQDDIELDFFEEPDTVESPRRPGRRGVRRGGAPAHRGGPPPGTVVVARLAGAVFLAIAIVVGLVVGLGGGEGTGEYASYMASVQPLAQSSARAGTAFAAELGASKLTLAGLEAKLRQWSQQQQRDYDRAEQLRPPGQLQLVHQELLSTLQLRAIGLAGLASVLAEAKGKDPATVAAQLAGEAQLFSASDIVWSELYRLPAIQALKTVGATGVVVPTSQFVANPDVISSRSFALVYQRLQPASTGSTGGTASGLHGSALVSTVASAGGNTQTLSTTSPVTVAVSQGLTFDVAIEDSGNFPETNIPVTLTVTVGGSQVYSQKQTIAAIQPKQQATATFGNLNLPTSSFSHSASLTVAVGKVRGETRLDNNSATYQVFFSLPSGQ